MKSNITYTRALLFAILLAMVSVSPSKSQTAGTATASQDTICNGNSVTLFLSGYTGNIQWQRFNGSAWVNETAPGAQNDTFNVSLITTSDFRAFVSAVGQPDDSSNVVTVGVITVSPPVATGATRCGLGQVTITATGNGTIHWYDAATGGTLLSTGNSYQPVVSSSTTFFAEANINGGSGQTSPLMITEIEVQTNDRLELQNVSPAPLDVTGWKLVASDSYTDINVVNSIVQTLSGILQPGDFLQFSDVSSIPVYWGNNLLWNAGAFPSFAGWLMLLDPNNVVKDLVFMNWPAASIANFNPIVQGTNISAGNQWMGGGVNITNTLAGISIQRTGNADHNDSLDWINTGTSFLNTNTGLVLPMQGFGCSSIRTAVNVIVTPADSVSINPSSAAICQGGNIVLNASSANSNYTCTWSPANGLSSAVGLSVTASPSATTTYVVLADDGTCAATDTITVEVNTPNLAGNIVSGADSICTGSSTFITTQSYNGLLQWQQNNGSGFVNASGLGSGNALFAVAPSQFTEYRLIAASPGCPADTSNVISIHVVDPGTPLVNDTARCGAGPVTLTASANGNIFWFLNQFGGSALGSGASFNTNTFVTTTYFAENRTGGNLLRVGPANIGFSPSVTDLPFDQGLLFSVNTDCTLETVYIYPDSSGLVTINLRQSAGGPILCTHSQVFQQGGKTPVTLNFSLSQGINYRLEVAAGSTWLKRNTSGAAYPYSNALVSIIAGLAPTQTSAEYFYLYDWEVSTGCRSIRVPLTVTINSIPPVPVISVNGTVLSSSSPTGNQWFLNGSVIPGATSQSYNVTQNGNYSVSVTINGCTVYSDTIFASSVDEHYSPVQQWMIYPNPSNGGNITLDAELSKSAQVSLNITDAAGRRIWYVQLGERNGKFRETLPVSQLSNGLYNVEINADGIKRNAKLSVIK
jgi:hypothetical protein